MVGTVTLGIEVELVLGFQHLPDREPPLSPSPTRETRTLERLLTVLDAAGVPITFDVVEHLIEGSCRGNHVGPHSAEWFDADPGTAVGEDPTF
jgi:hypothetical protein